MRIRVKHLQPGDYCIGALPFMSASTPVLLDVCRQMVVAAELDTRLDRMVVELHPGDKHILDTSDTGESSIAFLDQNAFVEIEDIAGGDLAMRVLASDEWP